MPANDMLRKTIWLHRVSKRFDAGAGSCTAGVVALRDASVEIRPGQVLVVAGPPGAGKTTLLLCAAGLLLCDGGDVGHRERHTIYVDLSREAAINRNWSAGASILLDSCDDLGELKRVRLVHAVDAALSTGSAVVIAGRDARSCFAAVPPSATVSVVHLRLGQIENGHAVGGVAYRVAEGATGTY